MPEATDNSTDPNALDFSDEEFRTETNAQAFSIEKKYNPAIKEDSARRAIAYLLIGLLWFLVIAMMALLAFDRIQIADIKEFSVVLGPVVTLVSAATGFYYGTKNHTGGKNND